MQECPLEKNNYIDHTLFTKSSEDCREVIEVKHETKVNLSEHKICL